jgi:hypothetical protein|tara:strand:- start:1971 stop:2120 length:150 start_codon:yes stop_codon:yes gene_type:complete
MVLAKNKLEILPVSAALMGIYYPIYQIKKSITIEKKLTNQSRNFNNDTK